MSLETEVAALTTATTDLLEAVAVPKSVIEGAAPAAAAQVVLATEQANLAAARASEVQFITSLYLGAL